MKIRVAARLIAILLCSQSAQAQFVWQTMVQPFDQYNSTYGFENLSCFGKYSVVAGIMNAQDSAQSNTTETQ